MGRFPPVPEEARPRDLYFEREQEPLVAEALRGRGYRVVYLATLPRRNDQEQGRYHLAKLQGLEEGTIPGGEEARLLARLGMEAFGLLNTKSIRLNLHADAKSKDLAVLFDFGKDRHTLRDNTTVVGLSMSNEVSMRQAQAEMALEDKRIATAKKLNNEGETHIDIKRKKKGRKEK